MSPIIGIFSIVAASWLAFSKEWERQVRWHRSQGAMGLPATSSNPDALQLLNGTRVSLDGEPL